MMRRLTTAFVLAVLAIAAAAPASALAQDNVAEAINTKDDSALFELAFALEYVTGDVIDQGNAAVAYASCERCQTVAIAVQVVIVMTEGPDTVIPTNVALAINEECSVCTTMALAYQFVLGGDGPLRLTRSGRRQIARIRRELRRLGRPGLSPEEIRAGADALMDALSGVLDTELVPDRRRGSDDGERQGDPERADGEPLDGDEPVEDDDSQQGADPAGTEPSPSEPAPSTTPTETEPTPTPEDQPAPESAPEESPTETAPEEPPATETTPPEQPAPEDGTTQTSP